VPLTRVGFYVVQASDQAQRLAVAVRLTDKAFQNGHRIFINACDEGQARRLDEMLWTYRPASFLPHGLSGEEHDDTIAIGWGQEPQGHNDLLINMQAEIPPFFSRFQRVAEIVTRDPESLAASRRAWRQYQARGYQLEKHDM
jgi:DNA polymerase-3 subunit chi